MAGRKKQRKRRKQKRREIRCLFHVLLFLPDGMEIPWNEKENDAHVQFILSLFGMQQFCCIRGRLDTLFLMNKRCTSVFVIFGFCLSLLGFGATMKETLPLQWVAYLGINLGTFKLLYNSVEWVVFLLLLSDSSCPLPG